MTNDGKIKILKDIIRDLHAGGDIEILKKHFAALVHDVSGAEIGAMEQQLIDEGLPEEEVRKLCDLHVKVFEESLDAQPAPQTVPGHPLHTLAEENMAVARIVAEARDVLDRLRTASGPDSLADGKERLSELLDDLSQIEKHYLKKENQLFPRLEDRGISGPSKVMWAVHDDIRAHLKDFRRALDLDDTELIIQTGRWVLQEIGDMVAKEEKILFPMAIETLDEADWAKVKKGEEEIGYAWIAPAPAWAPAASAPAAARRRRAEPRREEGAISLDRGVLTRRTDRPPADPSPGRHQLRRRERYRGLLFGDAGADLPPVAGRHRPEGPELPPAQERRRRREDPEGFPFRRTILGRVLDRVGRQIHPHPLLRAQGQAGEPIAAPSRSPRT